ANVSFQTDRLRRDQRALCCAPRAVSLGPLSLLDHACSAPQSTRSSRAELFLIHRTRVRFRLWLGGAVALSLRFARRSVPPPLHFRPPTADRSGLHNHGHWLHGRIPLNH